MKHLLWFSGFLTLLLAGDRLGGLLLQRQVDASLFRYSRLYRGEAGADLLFVGNSRGLTFYQPFIEEKTGLLAEVDGGGVLAGGDRLRVLVGA